MKKITRNIFKVAFNVLLKVMSAVATVTLAIAMASEWGKPMTKGEYYTREWLKTRKK